MSTNHRIVAIGAAVALLAYGAVSLGDDPAAAPPTASATAKPDAEAAPLSSLAAFDASIPTETSPTPTAVEWRDAPEVAPTRRGPRASGCKTYRVREWIRIACSELVTASIATLGGTVQGNAYWIDPQTEGKDAKLPSGGEMVFPVRKGDRRVIQILTFGPGYEGPLTQLPAIVVQEHWLDDEESPVLTIL
ncbi:MAG: hypothetical protein HOW73_04375 [Polyangiaceae bacterium]|nr:hypothetical protein [Polyangiaceae bacterium]